MNAWQVDLQEWIDNWFSQGEDHPNQFERTQAVAIRGGWNPSDYTPDMKSALHEWLSKWYTLSEKNMPSPATRRNPADSNDLQEYEYLLMRS